MFANLSRRFTFNAAHCLPLLPAGHKCHRLHGHDYEVELVWRGRVHPDGFVIDYDRMSEAWQPLFDQLDHRYLNDVPGLETPSIEIITYWIWKRLRDIWPGLAVIRLRESQHAQVEVTREDYDEAMLTFIDGTWRSA